MSWQDVVLAAGGFVISLGIIPTIRGPVKPPILTTLTLVGVLAASFFAFLTLGLLFTSIGVGLQTLLWGWVLAQTLAVRRNAAALAEPTITTPDLGFEEFQPAE
ncbi:MAG: hypothetical protein O2798_08935 [Chloroflexi bacterium]|nr:hypothetical protein [Chloroflexota bacterium]MDA1240949.1 hypothetical protein [Chloroflexota bacterium]